MSLILRTNVELTGEEGTFQEEMNDVQVGRGKRKQATCGCY